MDHCSSFGPFFTMVQSVLFGFTDADNLLDIFKHFFYTKIYYSFNDLDKFSF